MGDKSAIEWTDATWNPVTGCTKVSQGCKHCYAERVFARVYNRDVIPTYEGSAQDGFRPRTFTDVRCHPERLDQPLRWKKPRRIFVNSMSDLFHEAVPDEFIDQVFGVMALSDHHTFQILTKRIERARKYLSSLGDGRSPDRVTFAANQIDFRMGSLCDRPLPNVQLGVSVEDQPTADERIPRLLQTPAAVRFISAEPLLAAITLRHMDVEHSAGDQGFYQINSLTGRNSDMGRPCSDVTHLDWVIAGGESGPGARPMHPDWVRSLRDQCVAAGVPFFFKQWGEWGSSAAKMTGESVFRSFDSKQHWINKAQSWMCRRDICVDLSGKILNIGADFDSARFPVAILRRVGKKAAGAVLDGREWREFPR